MVLSFLIFFGFFFVGGGGGGEDASITVWPKFLINPKQRNAKLLCGTVDNLVGK